MDETFDETFNQKKNVLSLRLQQRRPREVLADQGIIPPLNSPGPYFHEVQRLERARNKDFLNNVLPTRPDREVLVQRHILEDTTAAGSLVANQKDLKKAKLVDDLNDKIALRPGVIELVERNIIPVDEGLQEALKGGQIEYKRISDFLDEDSSDALSPEQPVSLPTTSVLLSLSSFTSSSITTPAIFTTRTESTLSKSSSGTSYSAQNSSHPYLSRQTSKSSKSGSSSLGSKMVSVRKKKEKSKFKKLKYHQYIPPDQMRRSDDKISSVVDSDTPYSRLLQQQQVYLQMQIMNNMSSEIRSNDMSGKASFNQGSIPPPPAPPMTHTLKVQKLRNPNSPLTISRVDEMKVSELKEELKQRGQKVTGTKEVLVERLKPFCVSSDKMMSDDTSSNFAMSTSSLMSEIDDMQSSSQTSFFDPKPALSPRVARMPVPERHTVVKRELLTMPTWNHTGESMGTQTAFSPGQPANEVNEKDKILEQQRQEINALKQSLEMTKAQLENRQFYTPNISNDNNVQQVKNQDQLTTVSFQFPNITLTNNTQTSSTINNPNLPIQFQQVSQNPSSFSQTFEIMNGSLSQSSVPEAGMDELLDLLSDATNNSHHTPVTQVLLNDFESYHGLNNTGSNLNQGGAYAQQSNFVVQKPVRMRRQQHPINRHSQDYCRNSREIPSHAPQGPDVAKMLVETAGDALMDTSFPPVSHRYSCPTLDQHQTDHTRLGSRNSVDSGLHYSSSHFSPMDTASVDTGSRADVLNDLRLSTSSPDSNEQLLNIINMSPGTPSQISQPHVISLSHELQPSHRSNYNINKSREVATNTTSTQAGQPNDELGWLDLTLGSAVAGPPSPTGLLEMTIANNNQPLQTSQQNNPLSNHASQTIDMNLFLGDSGLLSYPENPNNLDFQWDSIDGIFNSDLNT